MSTLIRNFSIRGTFGRKKTQTISPGLLNQELSMGTIVFGVELVELCSLQGTKVPFILEDISHYILKHKTTRGLFESQGNNLQIENLKTLYNANPATHFKTKKQTITPVSAAQVLKQYFMELPEPLLMYKFYKAFCKVSKIPDILGRLRNYRVLVQQGLPAAHRETLIALLRFLKKVTEGTDYTFEKIADIWGPIVLKPRGKKHSNKRLGYVKHVFATLLEHVDYVATAKNLVLSNRDSEPIEQDSTDILREALQLEEKRLQKESEKARENL